MSKFMTTKAIPAAISPIGEVIAPNSIDTILIAGNATSKALPMIANVFPALSQPDENLNPTNLSSSSVTLSVMSFNVNPNGVMVFATWSTKDLMSCSPCLNPLIKSITLYLRSSIVSMKGNSPMSRAFTHIS